VKRSAVGNDALQSRVVACALSYGAMPPDSQGPVYKSECLDVVRSPWGGKGLDHCRKEGAELPKCNVSSRDTIVTETRWQERKMFTTMVCRCGLVLVFRGQTSRTRR
jgi:hypothetical protein